MTSGTGGLTIPGANGGVGLSAGSVTLGGALTMSAATAGSLVSTGAVSLSGTTSIKTYIQATTLTTAASITVSGNSLADTYYAIKTTSSTAGITVNSGSIATTNGGIEVIGASISGNALSIATGATVTVGTRGIVLTSGNLTLAGTGALTVSFTTGNVTVTSGTVTTGSGLLSIAGITGLATTGTGTVTIGSGGLTVSAGHLSASGAVSLAGSTSIDDYISATSLSISAGTISVAGTTEGDPTGGKGIYTTGSDGISITGGTLTVATRGIQIASTGSLVLNGGNVTISAGGLVIGAGDGATAPLRIVGTNSLLVTGAVTVTGTTALDQITVASGGTFRTTSGTVTLTNGNINVANGATEFSVLTSGNLSVPNGNITVGTGLTIFTVAGNVSAATAGKGVITLNSATTGATHIGGTLDAITLVVGENATVVGLITVTGGYMTIASAKILTVNAGGLTYSGSFTPGTYFSNLGSIVATTGNISIFYAVNSSAEAVVSGAISTTTGKIYFLENSSSANGVPAVSISGTLETTGVGANITLRSNSSTGTGAAPGVNVGANIIGAITASLLFDSNTSANNNGVTVGAVTLKAGTLNLTSNAGEISNAGVYINGSAVLNFGSNTTANSVVITQNCSSGQVQEVNTNGAIFKDFANAVTLTSAGSGAFVLNNTGSCTNNLSNS